MCFPRLYYNCLCWLERERAPRYSQPRQYASEQLFVEWPYQTQRRVFENAMVSNSTIIERNLASSTRETMQRLFDSYLEEPSHTRIHSYKVFR